MKRRTGWIAGLAAMAVLLATAVTAFAYKDQVKGVVTVSAHGTVTCGTGLALTAAFVDANGLPVSGLSVDWSFVTSSASDTLNKTPTTTDSKGVATTAVTLGPVSGSRTIKATAGTVSATAVLSASCHSGGVLPNTSMLPPSETAPGQAAPFLGMLLALLALAFAVGGGLTLRHLASTRR